MFSLKLLWCVMLFMCLVKVDGIVSNQKVSLAFVFDTTGSMFNDLKQLKESAESILNTALEDGNSISNFVLVPFNDPVVGPATVTTSKEDFKTALSRIYIQGGGDCPERSLTGIELALNVSLPQSFVYVLTDATASDYSNLGRVLDLVQRTQSQIVFLLTGHCNDIDKPNYKVYQQIAATSSGQVFNLNKTSVYKVLDFVKSSIKGKSVNLGSGINLSGYDHAQDIPIDNLVGEMTVAVSGSRPQIQVYNPEGHEVRGAPAVETTLDLAEIMVVKVNQPEPGNWSIKVGSLENYSFKVVGMSNLTFVHGFSVHEPKRFEETSFRPLKGTFNYMLISLTESEPRIQISNAEILSLNGSLLVEVLLKPVEGQRQMYIADAFIPPDDFFYIAINGHDNNGAGLRRVGTTAVQPKTPDVPYLTAPSKIEAHLHSRITLECQVESLVPLNGTWAKGSKRIQPWTHTLQTTVISNTIEDLTEETAGSYRCIASNVAGLSKANTEVYILVDPPQVVVSPVNTTVYTGDTVHIKCEIQTESKLSNVILHLNGTEIRNYTKDCVFGKDCVYEFYYSFVADEGSVGVYTWIAENKGGKSTNSSHVHLETKPEVQIIGPKYIKQSSGHTITLKCLVENSEKIQWIDPNNNIIEETVFDDFDVYTSELVLGSLNLNDSGVWTCLAQRGDFKAQDTLSIDISMVPQITISGSKTITLQYGSAYNLVCKVIAKPTPGVITWRKDNADISFDFDNEKIISPTPHEYQKLLILSNINDDTAGIYECYSENDEGFSTETVHVVVRRNMEVVKGFGDSRTDLYAQIELDCNITALPPPSITWFFNDTALLPSNKVYISPDNGTLFITRVDLDNIGSYKCEARNLYENMTLTGVLSVKGLGKPELVKEPTKHEVLKGHNLNITCRVLKGLPIPQISWSYRQQSSDDYKKLVSSRITVGEDFIMISNLSDSNTGIYRCYATNHFGNDFYESFVEVQYLPKIQGSPNKEVEVIEGDIVELPCKITGYPIPEVQWYQSKDILKRNESKIVRGDHSLSFTANLTDFSNYTCEATNKHGHDSITYNVLVWVPPTITNYISPTTEVLRGGNVSVPCDAVGFPIPVLNWVYERDNFEKTDTELITGPDQGLLLTNVTFQDEGKYCCVVSNVAGEDVKCTRIYVYEYPQILLEDFTGPFLATDLDTILILPCRVEGVPKPSLKWIKDNITLTIDSHFTISDKGGLLIHHPKLNDSGLYTCAIENKYGKDNKSYEVQIYSLPIGLKTSESNLTITLIEGDNKTIECPVKDTYISSYHVKWYKNSEVISATTTLEIINATRSMSSIYACVASNKISSIHTILKINVEWQPKFLEDVATLRELIKGNDYFLDCKSDCEPLCSITWKHNSDPILNYNHSVYKILNTQIHHGGDYECIVQNKHGVIRRNYSLQVYEPPFISYFDKLDIELQEDRNTTLDCIARGTPKPEIKWIYNNALWIQTNNSLSSTRASIDSEGIFTCEATNKAGKARLVYQVVFISRPKIVDVVLFNGIEGSSVEGTVEIMPNTKLRLSCQASGYPAPLIQWISNYDVLKSNQDNLDIPYADLNLDGRESKQDKDSYVCVAANKIGVVERRIRADWLVKPTIITSLANENRTAIQQIITGHPFTLHCHPQGNPSPDLYWFKDDIPLRLFDDKMYFTDNGEVVLSNNALEPQSGNYTCVARNKVGETSFTYLVDVVEPPTQPKGQHTVKSLENRTVTFSCPVSGKPAPKVYWKRNIYDILDHGPDIDMLDGNKTLIINQTKLHDAGIYTCIQTNLAGSTETNFKLDILVPPSIGEDETKHLKLGGSTVLRCEAHGVPTPNYLWYKDALPLTGKQIETILDISLMTLWKVNTRNAGQYACVAENEAGTDQKRYNIFIKVPGKWSPWSNWSYCNVTCGVGYQTRHRSCDFRDDHVTVDAQDVTSQYVEVDEGECVGGKEERRKCRMPSCDEDETRSAWSMWSRWSPCSSSCGDGSQMRIRKCTGDQERCTGDNVQLRKCPNIPECPSPDEEEDSREPLADPYAPEVAYEFIPEVFDPKRPHDFVGTRIGPDIEVKPTSTFHEVIEPANLDKSERGPCQQGLRYNSIDEECEDIDECLIEYNKCHSTQACENIWGGYRCSCQSGFVSLGAGQRCIDINECELDTHSCEFACVNTAGGYVCACPTHLRLHVDKRHCVKPADYMKPLS